MGNVVSEKHAVLYLGSEEECISSFKDRCSRVYTVHPTSTIDEGRTIMQCQPIEVVVVLYSFLVTAPGNFLRYISEAYPEIVRILIIDKYANITKTEKEHIGALFPYLIISPYSYTELQQLMDTLLKVKKIEKEEPQSSIMGTQQKTFFNNNDEKEHAVKKTDESRWPDRQMNEQGYKELLFYISDWMWEIDRDGCFTDMSGNVKEITGYGPEELMGKTIFDCMIPGDALQVKNIFRQSLQEKKPILDLEITVHHLSGEKIRLLINSVPLLDRNNIVIGYRGSSRKITRQKETQVHNEFYLDNLLNRIKELNCVYEIMDSINKDRSIDEIFTVALNMVPLSFEYPCIACCRICFHNAEFYSDGFEKSSWLLKSDIVVKGIISGAIEVYYKEKRPMEEHGPFTLQEKKMLDAIAQVLGMMLEHKMSENALKYNEERYALAQRFAGIGSWDWDIGTGEMECSREVYKIMGFRSMRKQITYDAFMQQISEKERKYVHDAVHACIDGGKEYAVEHHVYDKDGTVRWVSQMGNVIRDNEGNAIRMLGVIQDITSQKQSEEALRASHDRIDAIIKSVADGLIVTDCQHNVLLMNHAAEELLCINFGEVKNKPIEFAIEERTLREKFQRLYNQIASNYEFDFNIQEMGKKGPRIIHARTSVIHDENGKQTGIVSIVHDVTHIRELDRIKNEFISTAAHELRTPLTSIQGFSEILLLRENLQEKEKHKFLIYINQQAVKLTNIVNDLLDVSRIESGKGFSFNKQKTDIVPIIKNMVQLFQGISGRHTIAMKMADAPVMIKIDKDKIEQMFKNLLSNAIKYSPEGGTITISGEKEKGLYHIVVDDEGIGMTRDQIDKIFDKFYRVDSSNSAPEGTGLGMTIVKYIVEAHDGQIMVESEYGKGTTIHVVLPCSDNSVSIG